MMLAALLLRFPVLLPVLLLLLLLLLLPVLLPVLLPGRGEEQVPLLHHKARSGVLCHMLRGIAVVEGC